LDSVFGFRYAIDCRVRPKPRPFPSSYAFSCSSPTSAYPRHYPGHLLLGVSPSTIVSGLAAYSHFERTMMGYSVPCIHFA
jgi:hypothetical protein